MHSSWKPIDISIGECSNGCYTIMLIFFNMSKSYHMYLIVIFQLKVFLLKSSLTEKQNVKKIIVNLEFVKNNITYFFTLSIHSIIVSFIVLKFLILTKSYDPSCGRTTKPIPRCTTSIYILSL